MHAEPATTRGAADDNDATISAVHAEPATTHGSADGNAATNDAASDFADNPTTNVADRSS